VADFVPPFKDDSHRYYGGAALVTGMAIGAAASSDYLTYEPCSTTVVVDNTTYYNCDASWYTRGYEGGEVVYVVTPPPPGY
jgi:hypothetical protein